MSKKQKKSKKPELDWADDQSSAPETEVVGHLVNRAAEALSGLMEDVAGPEVEDEGALTEGEEAAITEVEFEPAADEEDIEGLDFLEEDGGDVSESGDVEDVPLVFEDEDSPAGQLDFSAEGTELEGFEPAEIEVQETLSEERIVSIVESLLFATDRPQSVAMIKTAFKGTNVRAADIRGALNQLQIEYAGATRGVYLEEVAGGYQLRTKPDNMEFLRRTVKAKPFRVSGPALEVLAIVAYKEPTTKSQIDEIRGVESGHLLRALMEKSLVHFAGKSELPGKPMLYGTTRRFLEIFGLRNLDELPSISEIDQLIPEGIGDEEEKETLDTVTEAMAKDAGTTYSEGEEELNRIAADLEKVTTTTDFFEQEKARMKKQRDAERAQDLKEALTVGETISDADRRWLDRWEREQLAETAAATAVEAAPADAVETEEIAVAAVAEEAPPGEPSL